MLTKLTARNFKRFANVEIELGNPVVFIGPNNSGKTTALQALALWEIGIRRWFERRGESASKAQERIGVTINRNDVLAAPIRNSRSLWRDLHVREQVKAGGKRGTRNIRIDIIVEGVSTERNWVAGLEFDYFNEESFVVRPLRLPEHGDHPSSEAARFEVPLEAQNVKLAFLPPMSGLAAREFRKERGEINVLIGEARTAEVLRNLCHQIAENREGWQRVTREMERLFGVQLDPPAYDPERAELTMEYREVRSGVKLDLSSSGRGLQQTLLLLAYLYANPGAILLVDEPDAHLEIRRQRQIYQLLTDVAREQGNQLVIASHSEIVLNEAAERDVVVAFLGRPHRINDRGTQVIKSLRDVGFEQYYLAEQTGWVLYLEGSTDMAILQAFARTLKHPAQEWLERAFVHPVQNQPQRARDHFYGLREAKHDLVGFALFDRLDQALQERPELQMRMWQKREIENYLCMPVALTAYAEAAAAEAAPGPLFAPGESARWRDCMRESIEDYVPRAASRDPADRWWIDTKMSDEFLDRLFESFFRKLGLPNLMRKTNYHVLAQYVPSADVAPEVADVLDAIVRVAQAASPAEGS